MKFSVFIFGLFLLSGILFAVNATPSSCGDVYTDLTLNDSVIAYDNETCFNILNNSITLDGSGYFVSTWNGSAAKGVYANGSSNITIKNLKLNYFKYGIYGSTGSNITIYNNVISVIHDFSAIGIQLTAVQNSSVKYNEINISSNSSTGISAINISNILIDGNKIRMLGNSSLTAVLVSNGSNVSFYSDHFYINGDNSQCINLSSSSNNGANFIDLNTTDANISNSYGIYIDPGSSPSQNNLFENVDFILPNSGYAVYQNSIGQNELLDLINSSASGWLLVPDGELNVTWQQVIYVRNSLFPHDYIEGASVQIWDKYGTKVFDTITPPYARVNVSLSEFVQNISYKKYYTPHTVNVTKSGYIPNSATINVSATSGSDLIIYLSLEPEPPLTCGDVYTDLTLTSSIFTDNETCFNLLNNNIILDGNGYSVSSNSTSAVKGVLVNNFSNITIKNLILNNFQYGIYANTTSNLTIYNNTILVTQNFSAMGIQLIAVQNSYVKSNEINISSNGSTGISAYNLTSLSTLYNEIRMLGNSSSTAISVLNSSQTSMYFDSYSINGDQSQCIKLNLSSDNTIYALNLDTTTANISNSYGIYIVNSSQNNLFEYMNFILPTSGYAVNQDSFGQNELRNLTNTSARDWLLVNNGELNVTWWEGVEVRNFTDDVYYVTGASAIIWDKYGTKVFDTITPIFDNILLSEFVQNISYKKYYTPHTVNVTKFGYIPNSTTINLSATIYPPSSPLIVYLHEPSIRIMYLNVSTDSDSVEETAGIEDSGGNNAVLETYGTNWNKSQFGVGYYIESGIWKSMPVTYGWYTIAGSETQLNLTDDELSGNISVPFNVTFYGNKYDKIKVSSNGFITFDTSLSSTDHGCCTGQNLPDATNPNNVIAGIWEDLRTAYGGGAGNISYATIDSSPTRKFIVQFDQVAHYPSGTPVSFQIVFYER